MIKTIGMFMVFTTILGLVELAISFMIISHNLRTLASEGAMVHASEVFCYLVSRGFSPLSYRFYWRCNYYGCFWSFLFGEKITHVKSRFHLGVRNARPWLFYWYSLPMPSSSWIAYSKLSITILDFDFFLFNIPR